ncbi:MAG: hypothetical protein AAF604_21175 [Acidobacteriota bacterium]
MIASSIGRRALGSSLVLLLLLMLAACGPQPTSEPAAPAEPAVDSEPAHDEAHHDEDVLPLPKRLAFMSGHVEAGLALYRAGEPEMASTHLLHPVSETHADERVGLDALGFEAALFEVVSEALENGLPAAEIEPQLAAAEANLAQVTGKAGGDPKEIVAYLMDTVVEEYEIGVPEATVTDPGEYQDAFGFTVVAIQRAEAFEGEAADRLHQELEALLALWPEAPVPPEAPTSFAAIEEQVERVREALAAIG